MFKSFKSAVLAETDIYRIGKFCQSIMKCTEEHRKKWWSCICRESVNVVIPISDCLRFKAFSFLFFWVETHRPHQHYMTGKGDYRKPVFWWLLWFRVVFLFFRTFGNNFTRKTVLHANMCEPSFQTCHFLSFLKRYVTKTKTSPNLNPRQVDSGR